MHRTKFKYEKKKQTNKKNQRAITQKLSKQELKFMCTALPLDEIYPPTKFHNHSKYSFGDMHRTKFKYEGKQWAITQKINKQELQFMCTALPFDEIYPPTIFHNHSWYSFGDMLWTKIKYENRQKSSMKINKGQ